MSAKQNTQNVPSGVAHRHYFLITNGYNADSIQYEEKANYVSNSRVTSLGGV
jgi:hypothetical protein